MGLSWRSSVIVAPVPNISNATYLRVPINQRKQVAALGAKWDGEARRWYVPVGVALAPFKLWLLVPIEQGDLLAPSTAVAAEPAVESSTREVAQIRGISLSQLLSTVSGVMNKAFEQGVWTTVDVVDLRTNNGHVYLEVAERDPRGTVVAKGRAMIWSNVANKILPAFERATGMTLAPGMKLLVRLKPNFHAQFGFGLVVEAVDAQYTLGDYEAKRREIRARLKAEGVWDRNRKLAAPWDFNDVLVVSPSAAAGLGDFRAEADRLHAAGVCRFVYAESRFQGEGAGQGICDAAYSALDAWSPSGSLPDAIVIIRGGGAVNDLAWLDDYCLARFICDAPVPVFTGIGHERDSTVLDEVAHTAFDTPSKVIGGIERAIADRAAEAKAAFALIEQVALRRVSAARATAERMQTAVRSQALHLVTTAKAASNELFSEVRHDSLQSLATTREEAGRLSSLVEQEAVRTIGAARLEASTRYSEIREGAQAQVAKARQATPLLLVQVQSTAARAAQAARTKAHGNVRAVLERAQTAAHVAGTATKQLVQQVGSGSAQQLAKARDAADALMREVAGQGPSKTLARGFAVVRNESGETVTNQEAGCAAATLVIEFHDGAVATTPKQEKK